jgi:phosphatidylglycerophosphatase C
MPSARVIVCFDFDGTITTSDSLRDFVLHTIGARGYALGLAHAAPWLAGFAAGLCDRGATKARFLAETLGGRSRQDLDAAAERFVEQRLPALIRPDMSARIQDHRRLGHRLLLVSASPSLYLERWAAREGFDAVLATELEFRGERFTGRLGSPNCWGPEKERRLRQWFEPDPPSVQYAYGDSRGDREMLALADHAWLRGGGPLPPL